MKRLGNSPARRYKTARNTLLALIMLTLVNCLLILTDEGSYYVSSIFLAYMIFDTDAFSILLTLLIVAPYVLAYFLSKRKGGWMIAAGVLFLIDTLVVVGYMVMLPEYAAMLAIDLIAHIVADVLLILGIKNRKIGTMTDEELMNANTAAGAAAAQLEGRGDAVGQMPEIECSISVSNNGKPGAFPKGGILRFEADELAVGAQGLVVSELVGSALAPMKEIARFSYGSIISSEYTNKGQTAVRIDLSDGRIICFTFSGKAQVERFLSLMQAKGVTLPPRTV